MGVMMMMIIIIISLRLCNLMMNAITSAANTEGGSYRALQRTQRAVFAHEARLELPSRALRSPRTLAAK